MANHTELKQSLSETRADPRDLRVRAAELEDQAGAELLPRRREILEVAAHRLRALADVAEGRSVETLLG